MNLNMIQEPVQGLYKYNYRFLERDEYYGTINCNPLVRNYYTLLKHGEPVLDVRQTSLWKVIMSYPFRVLFDFARYVPQYHVLSQEGEVGKSVVDFSWMAYTFTIQGNTYVLRAHSYNVGSLTENGRQIARYQWKCKDKCWERGQSVEIEYTSESHLKIILVFALMFEGFFCKRKNTHNALFLQDEYEHLAHWKSQGDR